MTTTTDELVTDPLITDEMVNEACNAWVLNKSLHQRDNIRAALTAVAPSLIARGLSAAADRVGQGFPDYDQRGMTAFQMGRMASEIYGMAAKIQMPLEAQKGEMPEFVTKEWVKKMAEHEGDNDPTTGREVIDEGPSPPSADTEKLIERLRLMSLSVCGEAASSLQELVSEVARLREALEPFARITDDPMMGIKDSDKDTDIWVQHDGAILYCGDFRRARAALAAQEKP